MTQKTTEFTETPKEEWNMYYSGPATIHYQITGTGIKIQGTEARMESDESFKRGVLKLLRIYQNMSAKKKVTV